MGKVRERKVKDRVRRSARSASVAAAKGKQNFGQPVAGTSVSVLAGPLRVPGFESDLESLSDLDDKEDDHLSLNSGPLVLKNTLISSASASTSGAPNLQMPPPRTPNSHLMLEGWSQLCLSTSTSLDNASHTKNTVPPTPSSAIITRNCSGTVHTAQGPG